MAKILIKNTRGHMITINHGTGSESIPATKSIVVKVEGNDVRQQIHGESQIEDSFLKAAHAKSHVVRHYFKEGWLTAEGFKPGQAVVVGAPATGTDKGKDGK
jgi:hypothetical protein